MSHFLLVLSGVPLALAAWPQTILSRGHEVGLPSTRSAEFVALKRSRAKKYGRDYGLLGFHTSLSPFNIIPTYSLQLLSLLDLQKPRPPAGSDLQGDTYHLKILSKSFNVLSTILK